MAAATLSEAITKATQTTSLLASDMQQACSASRHLDSTDALVVLILDARKDALKLAGKMAAIAAVHSWHHGGDA